VAKTERDALFYRKGDGCFADGVNEVEHVFGADKDDDNGEELPGDKRHTEADESAYTETGDGADGDLDESGEGDANAGMYGGHATHGEGNV